MLSPPAGPQTQPQLGDRESSPVPTSPGQLRPPYLKGQGLPKYPPLAPGPTSPGTRGFRIWTGPSLRKEAEHSSFNAPQMPLLIPNPKNEKQSHLSKHTPPTAKITLKWPLRRLPSRTREVGWRSERTQDQALLASPAQQLAGSAHRSHGLSGAKPAPQPEVTPTKEGMTLTPSSPKAPCNCVAAAAPSALPAVFLLAYLLSPTALI